MIFIYPASVSENCDKRIVPAVCKCIERFFLVQIQDAMSDGVLNLTRNFEHGNYGSIQMESVCNYNKKQLLTEQRDTHDEIEENIQDLYDAHIRASFTDSEAQLDDCNRTIGLIENEMTRINRMFSNDPDELDTLTREEIQSIRDTGRRLISHLKVEIQRLERILKNSREDRRDRERNDREDRRDRERNDREDARDRAREERERAEEFRRQDRDAREREQYEREKAEREYGSSGSYMPMDTKVDIVPTCGQATVSILRRGGKLNGTYQNDVRVNINVKVIPTIIKNFKVLERDLLNDYFTKKSEAAFKSRGRNIARACHNVLKKIPFNLGDAIWKQGMKLIDGNDDIENESRKDIIYNTHGFVNASAFHKSSSSPSNYNFTSNIVIFNKDDLTDPEDSNIFENRSAMVKLFKLGWSTFCMLDPVEEMMYFVSSLDGGYMHPIPYRYIMETFNSRAYYGTESKLKDSAKPFFVKRGNFSTFAKLFKKRK